MVGFKGSTQGKSRSEIFGFGDRKAANDKKVPYPAGSAPLAQLNGGEVYFS